MPDRLFVVTMNMHGVDHENFGSNEETRRTVTQETILSYPNQGLSVLEFIHGWGGECRFELRLTATLLGDKTIRVQGNALLYEGISEGTTELDGHREVSFIVPKGKPAFHNFRVSNDNEGDDFVDVQLACTNSLYDKPPYCRWRSPWAASALLFTSSGKHRRTMSKDRTTRPTGGSIRHGQAAGFRPAKVIGCVDRLSWFAPLVRAA